MWCGHVLLEGRGLCSNDDLAGGRGLRKAERGGVLLAESNLAALPANPGACLLVPRCLAAGPGWDGRARLSFKCGA